MSTLTPANNSSQAVAANVNPHTWSQRLFGDVITQPLTPAASSCLQHVLCVCAAVPGPTAVLPSLLRQLVTYLQLATMPTTPTCFNMSRCQLVSRVYD